MFENIGCIIMASGLGRRFGSNKLMADLGGRPMIEYILRATDGLFARRIVVTRHEDVQAYCAQRGVEVILHALPHRSDTIRLGIEAMGENVQACMFCPGDQPLLMPESIVKLLSAAQAEPDAIFQLAWVDAPGMPVCFPRWAFGELMHLPEGRGGNVLMKKYPERMRRVSAREEFELMDVDCPEDLERVLGILNR